MDVWLRKNKLAPEINDIISRWRYSLFYLLYCRQDEAAFQVLMALIEKIGGDALPWVAAPERSKTIYLNLLNEISDHLADYASLDRHTLALLNEKWCVFFEAHKAKCHKIKERIEAAEQLHAHERFCYAKAQAEINQRFVNRIIPLSVQRFIESYFFPAYSQFLSIQSVPGESTDTVYAQLLNDMFQVFCRKGEAGFKKAGVILDELEAELSAVSVTVPAVTWEAMEADILALLQKNTTEGGLFSILKKADDMADFSQGSGKAFPSGNEWFEYSLPDSTVRIQVAARFEELGQVLWCNYLGMKIWQCNFAEYHHALKQKTLKRLEAESTLAKVLSVTLGGLKKVAASQSEARAKAAEKAQAEAENLLKQQEKADAEAKQRADDIAQRTRQIKLKQDEKKRLEKERKAIEVLSSLHLGAWIAVDNNGEKLRYKLAVKFSATKRYVFVDKLGIRKIEFIEPQLIEMMVAGEIEVLSDGAEFEASLERVVSRIRMSK